MYTTKSTTEKIKLWSCPKCGREFQRKGQAHSCRAFPIEEHFSGKPKGKLLYGKLKSVLRKHIGHFKVESLECCIHFTSVSTFAAVKILKDKIRVDFSLDKKIKSKRFVKVFPMSKNRDLYVIDIDKEEDIDEELITWMAKAYYLKNAKIELELAWIK